MIGEHSDFMSIKILIKSLMNQNVLTNQINDYFRRLLTKYIDKIEKVNGNIYLVQWAQ